MATGTVAFQNILHVTGGFNAAAGITELHLEDGRLFRIPTALLTETRGGETFQAGVSGEIVTEGITIPLVEEHLIVGKRTVATGTVRLQKTVQEFETTLNEPLAVRTFDVERIILNRPVETAPAVRQEGETTIYPLVEEQLILSKQLVLKEEIHVTKRDTERVDTQTVTLRREQIAVERS